METGVHFRSDFIAHLASSGNSQKTLDSYGSDLDIFFSSILKPAGEIRRSDIQQFFVIQLAEGISPRTLGRRLATLRTYYGFLLDIEEATIDPTKGVLPPKQPKKLQRAVTTAELDKMVASLGDGDVLDRVILLTLFASGLRASEFLNLEEPDLDLEGMTARVHHGKGGKDALVPLSPRAVEALQRYLEVYKPEGKLFPFTRQKLWYRVQKISIAVLGKKMGPHRLRAGTATALLKGGADIRVTQVVMRHAGIDTTQMYLDVDPTFARECYFKYHPRAKKND